MNPISAFKSAHQGKIFILKIKAGVSTLLSFTGVDELKEYLFADGESKQVLFDKMAATSEGQVFLHDQALPMDNEVLEQTLFLYADKNSMLEAIGHDLEECIIIDTDELNSAYWDDLQNSNSPLYLGKGNQAFAIISNLINKG